jgi:hypothetical protein
MEHAWRTLDAVAQPSDNAAKRLRDARAVVLRPN